MAVNRPGDFRPGPGQVMEVTLRHRVWSRFEQFAERRFKLEERGTSATTELRAGLATFLTMAYILLVNPEVLGSPHTGIPQSDVVVGTAAASALATFICGWFGNLPFGLAPGLGLSAYFSYGLVGGASLPWQGALTSCFTAGAVMLLLAITRLSDLIMKLIPRTIKLATVVGMGLLLTFIGMQTIGLVQGDDEGLVTLGDLGNAQVWFALGGLMLLSTLTYHGISGAVVLGIVVVTLSVWAMNNSWPSRVAQLPRETEALGAIDFSLLAPQYTPGVLAFLFVGIFDVSGVLFGLSRLGGLAREDGRVPGSIWAFIGASVGTMVAASLGCSPIIIHVESAAGIKEGGRTGLAAVTTASLFALSLFFAPLFESVPPEATAPVLILIGAMMMGEAAEIEWKEMDQAVPAFLTVAMMPFTFSIPNGIVFGICASFVLFFTTGKFLRYCTCCHRRRTRNTKGETDELIRLSDGTSRSEPTLNTDRTESWIAAVANQPEFIRRPSLLLRKSELPP